MPANDELNGPYQSIFGRSEEHTSELQSLRHLVCRLLLEKKIRRTPHLRQPLHSVCAARYWGGRTGAVEFPAPPRRENLVSIFFFNCRRAPPPFPSSPPRPLPV